MSIAPQPEQIFDGIDISDALSGKSLSRKAIFTYFPHSPPIVPDVLPPSATVVGDEWKLIRLFNEGTNGSHAYRLYNLKDDVGETKDLSAEKPERVKEMEAMLEAFLVETKAIVPKANPAYDPNAKVKTKSESKSESKSKSKSKSKANGDESAAKKKGDR